MPETREPICPPCRIGRICDKVIVMICWDHIVDCQTGGSPNYTSQFLYVFTLSTVYLTSERDMKCVEHSIGVFVDKVKKRMLLVNGMKQGHGVALNSFPGRVHYQSNRVASPQ